MTSACDLCEAAIITTRYYEDDLCWIADCEICMVPMVVWRSHDPTPPEELKENLRSALAKVANEVLGEGNWSLDDHMRNIPDHYHAHARRAHPWGRQT
ncbi:MAG: hypothetical protein ACYC19_06940 [Acidimicrobiales bacterium]